MVPVRTQDFFKFGFMQGINVAIVSQIATYLQFDTVFFIIKCMRIAIVGKGGSGKTTIGCLFSLYLDNNGKRVGLLDVDVNSHTAEVLGAKSSQILSSPHAQLEITQFLAGANPRVKAEEFLNTTPPGDGSGRWALEERNFITKNFGAKFGTRSYVFTLGSYTGDSVGADCHHTTQHTAENILTHAKLQKNDVLVVDSVAGNDTFANSLYLQDILLFVLKPEREGLSVYERYYALAEKAGVAERVYVLANQVNSGVERAFVEKHIPADKLVGIISSSEKLTAKRLDDEPLSAEDVSYDFADIFSKVLGKLTSLARTSREYHQEIVRLHEQVSAQDWVVGAHRAGLSDQIDPLYEAV
jgi:CO dehydrogenase maturation factor